MEEYTVGLIVIGDEILRGQILDTNTAYLAKSLRAAGLKLCKATVLPDVVDDIAQEVREASARYSIVFTSGGVGPTHDDVTYEAVAKGLGLQLELHEDLVNLYKVVFPNEEHVHRYAIVPTPCEYVYVHSTVTCAVIKAKNVYVLPGTPRFFKLAVDTIVPTLKARTPPYLECVDVEALEVSIVTILDALAERWKDKVSIGSYPQTEPRRFTRITLEGRKEDILSAKQDLLQSLPPGKVETMSNKFSLEQADSILQDSQEEHVKNALKVLNQCYDRYKPAEIFISFNGGKDCTVVLHLVAAIIKLRGVQSLPCLYVTTDPFPEVDKFVESAAHYYDLELIRKTRPVRTAVASLLSERCYLKACLMGMRKGDPGAEKLEFFSYTDPDWPQLMRVNPILDWSYNQVWQFLLKHKVPYCPLYDQGYTSIGARNSTMQNPLLKDPQNPSSYLPAYALTDSSAERQGRDRR